jgi:CHAD domain-containing protein
MVQNIESRLVKAIKRQAEKVVYYCSAENVSRDLAIHEIRKSFKRIRALLKFYPLTSDDSSQDYSAKISILARELSTARESFMNIRILEKITAKKQFIPEKSLENLKLQLTEKNKVLVKELLEGKRIFLEIQSLIYYIEGRLYDMIIH